MYIELNCPTICFLECYREIAQCYKWLKYGILEKICLFEFYIYSRRKIFGNYIYRI